MNAASEIQAAIERLTALKDASDGPWAVRSDQWGHGVAGELVNRNDEYVVEEGYLPYLMVIEVLHATIDAQMAVMRNFTEVYGESKTPNGYAMSILALARAINGQDG